MQNMDEHNPEEDSTNTVSRNTHLSFILDSSLSLAIYIYIQLLPLLAMINSQRWIIQSFSGNLLLKAQQWVEQQNLFPNFSFMVKSKISSTENKLK